MSTPWLKDTGHLPDRQWAVGGALAGLVGIASYVVLIAASVSAPLSATLAALFCFGFSLASIGLYLGVLRVAAPQLGLLAAGANVLATVELLAMLLVQIAVKQAVPRPAPELTAIWLGLDVAWDLFGAVGTVLFGLALWRYVPFSRALSVVGVIAGALLLVLNVATFPVPPANAGSFDMGPFVALWYVAVCVRVLFLARHRGSSLAAPN